VVKIGFDAAEAMSHLFPSSLSKDWLKAEKERAWQNL